MRDRLLYLLDRIPRWGELSSTQRALTGGGAAAVIIIALVAFWLGGAFGSGDNSATTAQPTGPSIESGFADCTRTASDRSDPAIVAATVGDMSGLPYQANFVEATSTAGGGGQIVVAVVCMRPDATIDQVKDVATILAQNIKSDSAVAGTIDMFGVVNVGDGDDVNTQVRTDFRAHPFAQGDGVYSQRGAWVEVPVN